MVGILLLLKSSGTSDTGRNSVLSQEISLKFNIRSYWKIALYYFYIFSLNLFVVRCYGFHKATVRQRPGVDGNMKFSIHMSRRQKLSRKMIKSSLLINENWWLLPKLNRKMTEYEILIVCKYYREWFGDVNSDFFTRVLNLF